MNSPWIEFGKQTNSDIIWVKNNLSPWENDWHKTTSDNLQQTI